MIYILARYDDFLGTRLLEETFTPAIALIVNLLALFASMR